MNKLRALLVIGTRPEAIKMAPLVLACGESASGIESVICFTGQHSEMLTQVADYFGLKPDVDLNLMRPNQTLAGVTARAMEGLDEAIVRYQPDCIVGQGDTTSVMVASLAAFYRRIPFVHVEAGLRTGNLQSPWPEEFNRRSVGLTATLHCAPTHRAAQNLFAEGVSPNVVKVTGNTVIDALLWTVDRERGRDAWRDKYAMLGDRRVVLITGHRRENFGEKFDGVCGAIRSLSQELDDVEFVYSVHPNPNAREPVFRVLGGLPNVHLIEAAPYPEFVWLMDRAHLLLTDSGGVQEEAPSLRRPVVVTRDTTERPEAVEAGASRLVGTSPEAIIETVCELLLDSSAYARCQIDQNPYGDGKAAQRIINLINEQDWAPIEPAIRRQPAQAESALV